MKGVTLKAHSDYDLIDQKNLNLNDEYMILDTSEKDVEAELKAIIKESLELNYHKGQFDAYKTLVLHYITKSYAEESLAYLRKAKVLIDFKLIDESYYPDVYVLYVIYSVDSNGDFDEAYKYYELGMKYARKYNNKEAIVRLKSNFGVMSLINKKYDIALEHFLMAKDYYEKTHNNRFLLKILDNLGIIYENLDDNENALKYFGLAHELAIKYHDTRIINDSVVGLTRAYVKNGEIQRAIDLAKETIFNATATNAKREVLVSTIELSRVYLEAGMNQEAYSEMTNIKKRVEALDNDWVRLTYYESMHKVCAAVNKYKEAYLSEQIYHKIDRELLLKDGEKSSHQIIEKEYRKTISKFKTISDIGYLITSSSSLDEVVNKILISLKDIMPVDSIGIGSCDGKEIVFDNFYIEGKKIATAISKLNDLTCLADWVVINDSELLIGNINKEYKNYIKELTYNGTETMIGEVSEDRHAFSIMYAPLKFNEKIIGVFTVQSYEKNAYTSEEFEIFHILSSFVSSALNHTNKFK